MQTHNALQVASRFSGMILARLGQNTKFPAFGFSLIMVLVGVASVMARRQAWNLKPQQVLIRWPLPPENKVCLRCVSRRPHKAPSG